MGDDELIPAEALAMVGQITRGPATATITAKEAQRYAQAVGDLNPLYFDEAAAHAAGYRTLTVPPTFLDYATLQGRPMSELRPDGLFQADTGLALKRVMFGGQEWDFVSPAYVGDEVTGVQRLASIEAKTGSKGPFVLVTWETTYTNQQGEVLARARQQGISR